MDPNHTIPFVNSIDNNNTQVYPSSHLQQYSTNNNHAQSQNYNTNNDIPTNSNFNQQSQSAFQVHTSIPHSENEFQNHHGFVNIQKPQNFGWRMISLYSTQNLITSKVISSKEGISASSSEIITFTGVDIPPADQEIHISLPQIEKVKNPSIINSSEQGSPSLNQFNHVSQPTYDMQKRVSPLLSDRLSTSVQNIQTQPELMGYSCPTEHPYNPQNYWNSAGPADSIPYTRHAILTTDARQMDQNIGNQNISEVNTSRDVYGGSASLDPSMKQPHLYHVNPYHTSSLSQSHALNMTYENGEQPPFQTAMAHGVPNGQRYEFSNDPRYGHAIMNSFPGVKNTLKVDESVSAVGTNHMLRSLSTRNAAVTSSPTVPSSPASLGRNGSSNSNVNLEFICGYPGCNKTFERRYNLTVHYRKHTDEKPYPCKFPDCPERFKWRSSQAHHIKTRHQGQIPPVLNRARINLRKSASTTRYEIQENLTPRYNTRSRSYQQYSEDNSDGNPEVNAPQAKIQRTDYGSSVHDRRYT